MVGFERDTRPERGETVRTARTYGHRALPRLYSRISPMPEGLLNSLKEEEIQDLIAYLLSRGDPESAMFR